jgi:hypothetical protein
MKKNIAILIFILIPIFNYGQSNYFLLNLAIKESSILEKNEYEDLKDLYYNKITNLIENTDGLIIDSNSNYILFSDFYISESNKSNAGVLPISNCKINLTLSLRYNEKGLTFKSIFISKEITGNNQKECLLKFINQLNINSNELTDLFKEGHKNMLSFYSENCDEIIKDVKKYQTIGVPEKALAICLSIPTNNNCYYSVSNVINDLYTIISYNIDYKYIIESQDFVSKGQYENAFTTLKKISKYSKFYSQAQQISEKINDFIFTQKELQKKKELADSEQRLKESEIELQQKRNELQESINQTNIEIANQKNESDRQIAFENQENQRQLKAMELQSQERKEMIKTAGNLLNSYINRPQPKQDTNFYIIRQ